MVLSSVNINLTDYGMVQFDLMSSVRDHMCDNNHVVFSERTARGEMGNLVWVKFISHVTKIYIKQSCMYIERLNAMFCKEKV